MFTILFILALVACAIATALIVREPEPKPVRIKRPPIPEHIRRHMAAQDRGDFNR